MVAGLSRFQLRRRLQEADSARLPCPHPRSRPQSARCRPGPEATLKVADAKRLLDVLTRNSSSRVVLPPVEAPQNDVESNIASVEELPPFDVFLEILRGAGMADCEFRGLRGIESSGFPVSSQVKTRGSFHEFVYVRQLGPYELELAPFREVDMSSYWTLSPAGLSHYVQGAPVTFVPLQRWLNERSSFRALRQLRFFQEFPARKAFLSWRNAGRRGRMAKAGQVLSERIFFLHPWFRNVYLSVRRAFQDVANLRCVRCWFAQPLTLQEFAAAQQNWQDDLFERAAQHAAKLKSEVFGVFFRVAEEVRQETCKSDFTRAMLAHEVLRPAVIRAGMPKEDGEALEHLGFCKDVGFAQRSKLRRECGRLLRFGRLVDLLCAETLVEVMENSVADVLHNLCPSEEDAKQRMIIKVAQAPGLCLDLRPNAHELHSEFLRWLRNGCCMANLFVQNSRCPELGAFRYIVRSAAKQDEAADPQTDEQLFDRLETQEAWRRSTGLLVFESSNGSNGNG
ncbi:unnamed protein product [Effrenium voratum]|nr:unnamed protein product [Effrenium voratum]